MRIEVRNRNGKASIWIGKKNVWDLPHEIVDEELIAAIGNAYNIGLEEMADYVISRSTEAKNTKSVGSLKTWDDRR